MKLDGIFNLTELQKQNIKDEIIMLEHFYNNPNDTYSNFYSINLQYNLRKIKSIAERLKRKKLLKCVRENDINGFLCSVKTVDINDINKLKQLLV